VNGQAAFAQASPTPVLRAASSAVDCVADVDREDPEQQSGFGWSIGDHQVAPKGTSEVHREHHSGD
jgi:hypothetical protein